LKDVVVFPRMVIPLLVGRPGSLAAVEDALATGRPLLLCTQTNPAVEEPGAADLYAVGVASSILQTLRMPDETMKIVVEGLGRVEVDEVFEHQGHFEARVKRPAPAGADGEETEAAMRVALAHFEDYVRATQRVSPEVVASLRTVEEPSDL